MLTECKEVLVVGAHPDDEVLGAGATIPLIKAAGGRVTVCIVTDGSSAQYAGDEETRREKDANLLAANEILGTDEVIHWDFPDMRLDTVAHVELNQAFERLFATRRFDTVFTHHAGDVNLDHQAIHRSVLVATRPAPGQTVKRILSYHVNSATEWGARSEQNQFRPNVYFDVGATIQQKLDALKCYGVELRKFPHPRTLEAVEYRARVWGSEVGYEYAEAFKLLLYRG
jgi:LmbE family N-acetylglucosaminyl deacetylase